MLPAKTTRGKTQPNRLRLIDQWVCAQLLPLQTKNRFVLDVGFGEIADTALNFQKALQEHANQNLVQSTLPHNKKNAQSYNASRWKLIATDANSKRVQRAQQEHAREDRIFSVEDFAIESLSELQNKLECAIKNEPQANEAKTPLPRGVSLIRVFNVLRQYNPNECENIHRKLGEHLVENGFFLEGTSDKNGQLASFHVFTRRESLERAYLVFTMSQNSNFGPWQFRDVLPQDVRRKVRNNTWLWHFFTSWQACATKARDEFKAEKNEGMPLPCLIFSRSVELLNQDGWPATSTLLDDGIALSICPTKDISGLALLG